MKQITVTEPFKRKIMDQAIEMLQTGSTSQVFETDDKKFEGMNIFIGTKPALTLFSFDFPDDIEEGKGKKIFVGNN